MGNTLKIQERMMNNLLKEAVQFFKKETGFHRLLALFIQKYRGLGRVGGSVKLQSLSPAEKEALSSFFRKDYSKQKSATISLEQFEKALESTKFSGVDVKELLEKFHGQPLFSKVEEVERFLQKREAFFKSLSQKYQHPYCQHWLEHIRKKGVGTKGIFSAYDREQESLKIHLEHVCSALTQLSRVIPEAMMKSKIISKGTTYTRLPLFASQITGDPHGFDRDKNAGRYLVHALQVVRQDIAKEYEYVSTPSAEEVTELLQFFGIVRDDVLNFTTCVGLLGYNKEVLPMWKAAMESRSVLNVPIRELIKVENFIPAENSCVFVVENSGVFSSILDQFEQDKVPPLICTHGQFKLATFMLLDKLAANDTMIYYSGDFDPEGLHMAQHLLLRYPQHTRLWHYDKASYLGCQSGLELSAARLNKVDSIHVSELQEVKDVVFQQRKSAYQEDLVPYLVDDMKRILGKGNFENE
jgi:uncharacterized protein (TIGR02679 family)